MHFPESTMKISISKDIYSQFILNHVDNVFKKPYVIMGPRYNILKEHPLPRTNTLHISPVYPPKIQ